MPIRIRPDGLKKRFSLSAAHFWNESNSPCLACQTPTVSTSIDLYADHPDAVKFAEEHSTMEAEVRECPKCKRRFVRYEVNDYDWEIVREVN